MRTLRIARVPHLGETLRFAASFFALLLVTACGSTVGPQTVQPDSNPPEVVSSTSTEPDDTTTAASSLDSQQLEVETFLGGAATSYVALILNESGEPNMDPNVGDPPGTITMSGCRWRAPGLYSFDLRFDPTEPVTYPVEFLLSQSLIRGDTGLGGRATVVLDGPGYFSVPYDEYSLRRSIRTEGDEGPSAQRSVYLGEQRVRCSAGDFDLSAVAAVSIDRIVQSELAPETLEGLATTIDIDDPDANLLPLPSFVGQVDPSSLDRLFVSPSSRPESIGLSQRGNCTKIRSTYEGAVDTTVRVTQSLRCQGLSTGSEPTIEVADDVWAVLVQGPSEAAMAIAADLRAFPLSATPPFSTADSEYDPNDAIDAQLAEGGLTEIARVPWKDGLVSVVISNRDHIVERYADPIVATPKYFGGGGGGTGCLAWSASSQGDADFGFFLFVVEDDSYSLTLSLSDGTERDIELTEALGGRAVAVVDRADIPTRTRTDFTVRGPGRAPVPCDQ